jgi:hypothetical protein
MNTFFDLHAFMLSYNGNLMDWLKNDPWEGKDKQESLLRLFSGLGCVRKLNDYNICKGNFNKKTIEQMKSIKDVFYDSKNKAIKLKDKGDSSDLTGIHKSKNKHLLLTTSKNIKTVNLGSLDIDKILTNFQSYDGYTMALCICIRDCNDYKRMLDNAEESNNALIEHLDDTTIVIDWNDLNEAFHMFQNSYYGLNLDDIINDKQKPLLLKMHQEVSVLKTMKKKKEKNVLWGHVQRSGKSYIIGGCIIEDARNKDKCNYLIITTAPKETIEQQLNVFDCIQLRSFNVISLNGNNKKPEIKDKNIIVCSKQFLQTKLNDSGEKTTSIAWLKKMVFDMRFLDESHNGGTTQLAKKTLDYYGNKAFTIQITATYTKPSNDYNIPKNNWILWDIEDITMCKKGNHMGLIMKHGEEMETTLKKYSMDAIVNEYSKFPEMIPLTHELKPEIVSEILNETKDTNYGWSVESCFLLKQSFKDKNIEYSCEFQNEKENLKMWYTIFGKKGKFGVSDKNYPDDVVFMQRIKSIANTAVYSTRFLGDSEEPMIIMAFLPQNNIDEVSTASKNLLEKHDVIPNMHVITINSKTTNDPKQKIIEARVKAKNDGKEGVLVLSGRQCSLGVSIDYCDIVLMLNNNTSYDMIQQMMYRCMTEGNRKKCGFVVDLDIHRVIQNTIVKQAMFIKPNLHPREATKYMLKERLISMNPDHWMGCFKHDEELKLSKLCETVYSIYSSNTIIALTQQLDRLMLKSVLLTKEDQLLFNSLFSNSTITKKDKETIEKLFEEQEHINKGIEKVACDDDDTSSNNSNDIQEDVSTKITYMEVLKHIIPLVCLLTIHDKETSFIEMFDIIKRNDDIYTLLINQTRSWWGKNVDTRILKKFITIYMKEMSNDEETNQIIRVVKDLFQKNVNNSKELSKLIDKYLIPQELEKKTNAEVSTPHKLRQEMLDTIPTDFWTTPKKVFEPCSGKGGFVIDIIDRFMDGLKEEIIDEKERYKTIVEECLYFGDINTTNIFICKLLVNPYNEYELNYYEGNTLELNIEDEWGVEGFDAVIGNPPYNASGNTGTGNTIWQLFVKKALNEWIIENGLLVYVHPPGWRKPNTTKGRFNGLFDLMTKENQMIYLSIHGIKDGQQTFKCGTRYDWYVIERKERYKKTNVNDEKGIDLEIDTKDFKWLPNYNIKFVLKLHAKEGEERCPIIYNRTFYGADNKKIMAKRKDNVFRYICIHSTPQSGTRYMYSKVNDKGHFGIPKVIFGESGIHEPVLDIDGKYGMTHGAMAIGVKTQEEGLRIVNSLTNYMFKEFINSCIFSSFRIDWNIFKELKRDFWKEFV